MHYQRIEGRAAFSCIDRRDCLAARRVSGEPVYGLSGDRDRQARGNQARGFDDSVVIEWEDAGLAHGAPLAKLRRSPKSGGDAIDQFGWVNVEPADARDDLRPFLFKEFGARRRPQPLSGAMIDEHADTAPDRDEAVFLK